MVFLDHFLLLAELAQKFKWTSWIGAKSVFLNISREILKNTLMVPLREVYFFKLAVWQSDSEKRNHGEFTFTKKYLLSNRIGSRSKSFWSQKVAIFDIFFSNVTT